MGEYPAGRVRTLLPHEIVRAMHGRDEARSYDVLELALDEARDHEEFPFVGNCVSLMYISHTGTPIYVKLNARDQRRIPFYEPGSVTRAFDRVLITHAAVAGGVAVFLLDWDLRT